MPMQQVCQVSEQIITEATDKVILSQLFLDSILREYTNTDLPSPLLFSVNCGSRKTHVGVREFSAPEGSIIMPTMVIDNLAVKAGMEVSVKLVVLEKGESVKLRPLAAGYNLNQDWKVALEGAFRSQFTTLTLGDVITIASGIRFLVDELRPADAVCIIDTDLEVVLEPLSEEQAIATVEATDAMKATIHATELNLEQEYKGQHDSNQIFIVKDWNQQAPMFLKLQATSPDMSIIVGIEGEPLDMRYNLWSNLSSEHTKHITVEPQSPAFLPSDRLAIKVLSDEPGSFTLVASYKRDDVVMVDPLTVNDDEELCRNCLVVVPKRSLVLHERHCLRNNSKCPHPGCTHIIKKDSLTNHWHCPDCSESGEGSLDVHMGRLHTPQTCECSRDFPNLSTLARHRATICPEKQHTCRFCHLSVSQGDFTALSYHDSSAGLTLHESTCGSKTINCETCNRPCLLKNMTTHMKIHDAQRKTHPVPRICKNQNCVRPAEGSSTMMDLCNVCFGPLYSSSQDPDGQKLAGRIKRRYATQLMTGCRRPSCRNVFCATATNVKMNYADALKRVDGISHDRAWFCVDEATQQARVLAETIECQGEYAIEWCCKATDWAAGDVNKAHAWLSREAVRKSEV